MTNEFPPCSRIPSLTLHESLDKETNPQPIVERWITSLTNCMSEKTAKNLEHLFIEESWWRDLVSLSWDFTSKYGPEAISQYLAESTAGLQKVEIVLSGALQPQLVDMMGMTYVQSGFNFQTTVGSGRGVVRLANVGLDDWKAWTVSTQLERLRGQEEMEPMRLRSPVIQQEPPNDATDDLKSRATDLQVLVVGAGQSGLAIAAHLQNLGLRHLVVEKSSQLGAGWRSRYDSIKSHTPSYSDHYPFLKFPTNWPRWLEKEHMVQWIESYKNIMGINVAHSVSVDAIKYDESTRQYTVEADTPSGRCIIQTKHIVLATGICSEAPIWPQFPGEKSYTGQIYHSSEHKSASQIPDLENKRITIVGCGASAHDIAQDLVNHGAKGVSIVQRHPIFTISLDSTEKFQMALWNTPGLSTEDADLLANSLPTSLARAMAVGITKMMCENDKTLLDGLREAGMALRTGSDGVSFLDYQIVKTGCFYIDQGASQMIIDGKIKIYQCEEGVKEFNSSGITLRNDTDIDSDVVILATGYERCDQTVKSLMGEEVHSKIPGFGLLDNEQERIGCWRPTGVPGFWYMTGSFVWCRQFSSLLALQIYAVEHGLNTGHYDA
ncbi:hypothetical protein QQS21_011463 [Conoideocrella luteorostrata]|uniref:Flavin-containing monooxygenase n=1 Tax=Conoideocrella luteorostrata TaxID=1105319 RepID=A0AAJ0CDB4_9HYPO|nr:hypothetical protein QQS21_011463 [Conoideocrella luteorostrata]